MKVIFLDIDGVLVNRTSFTLPRLKLEEHALSYHTADPQCIALLNRIVAETGARVVVSSVWRGLGMKRIKGILKAWNADVQIIGLTAEIRDAIRGVEIQAWLDAQTDVESFVILDDDSDMGQLKHRLVETEAMLGLTEADADRAIAILNAPPADLLVDRMLREVSA